MPTGSPKSAELHAQRIAAAAHRDDPRPYLIAKRVLDIAVSLALLTLSLPILVLLYVLIRIDSPGSAIFRQHRVAAFGGTFRFCKFRTMYVDAQERFPELYTYRYDDGELETMFFKLPYDPRLTRVGRWLRRTSLDELPNLFNVLRGDMSLVGPRPEIPEMLPHYRPDQLAKFTVKPGLTGLAQVRGRNILRFQETIDYDLQYVRDRSLFLDLRILVRTPIVVVLMIGAL